jgi:hypothetical protein
VKPPSPESTVEGIALELEQYLSSHPTAADTLAGIARWWIEHTEPPDLQLVEAALETLVRRGLVVRNALPDGNSFYASAARRASHLRPRIP